MVGAGTPFSLSPIFHLRSPLLYYYSAIIPCKHLEEQGDVEGAKAAYQRAIDSRHAEATPNAAVNLERLLRSTPPPATS